jgi:hypothetical protein
MILRLLDAEKHCSTIHRIRRRTLEELRFDPDHPSAKPLDYAVYLAAYSEGDDRPAGLAEAYFFDQAFPSYRESPFAAMDLEEFCPPTEMSYMRTIYVAPEHRGGPAYMHLSLAMGHLFHRMGARFAAITTLADSATHARLYESTGGTRMGQVAFPNVPLALALYLFDVGRLVHHPRLRRAVDALEIGPEPMRTLTDRRLVSAAY